MSRKLMRLLHNFDKIIERNQVDYDAYDHLSWQDMADDERFLTQLSIRHSGIERRNPPIDNALLDRLPIQLSNLFRNYHCEFRRFTRFILHDDFISANSLESDVGAAVFSDDWDNYYFIEFDTHHILCSDGQGNSIKTSTDVVKFLQIFDVYEFSDFPELTESEFIDICFYLQSSVDNLFWKTLRQFGHLDGVFNKSTFIS